MGSFFDEGTNLEGVLARVRESDLKRHEDKVQAQRKANEDLRKGRPGSARMTAGELVDRLVIGKEKQDALDIDVPEEEAPKQEATNVRPKATGYFPRPPGSS